KEIPDAPLKHNAVLVIIIFAGLLLAYPFLPQISGKPQRALDGLDQLSFASLLPIAVALLALVFILLCKRSPRTLIKGLVIFGAACGMTANFVAASLDEDSVK